MAALLADKKLPTTVTKQLFNGAILLTNVIMLVAVYVHLNPDVPAKVLPLQSKPPVLTLVVMVLAGLNYYLYQRNRADNHTKYSLITGATK